MKQQSCLLYGIFLFSFFVSQPFFIHASERNREYRNAISEEFSYPHVLEQIKELIDLHVHVSKNIDQLSAEDLSIFMGTLEDLLSVITSIKRSTTNPDYVEPLSLYEEHCLAVLKKAQSVSFHMESKAPRIDAPVITANDAVVGKDGCDLTQVLAILGAIKKRITNLSILICEKFEFTWSILEKIDIDVNGIFTALEDIQISVSIDLSGIFTVLEFDFNNLQTIICEKFEYTWSALQKIDIDVNGIFTAIDNIDICPTVDLTGIFTALEFDFNNLQTIICAKFEDTWSILQKIDIDVNGIFTAIDNIDICPTVDLSGIFTALEFGFHDTQTIICAKFEDTWSILQKIDIDINGIFTAIENINVNVSATVDLSGIFTALEFGFHDTQTIICAKFEDTWTILQKIDIDVNGIFTAIENIDICPTVDLSGIFTALEFGFFNTQTIICEKFEDTWTILQKIDIDVNGIFTAIENINVNVSATVDLSGIFTALEFGFYDTQTIICEKFEDTWSILQKIDIDVNGIFTAIDNIDICPTVDLSGIFTALEFGFYDTQTIICEKFEETWTILGEINENVLNLFEFTANLIGTLTADLLDTQTIICAKFEDTWTILQKIDIDVNGIFTAIDNIEVCPTVDLSGIFTALEFGFFDTQTIICAKFEDTWTILEKIDVDVNGIFTVLDNLVLSVTIGEITVSVSIDLSGVFTALEFGFHDTQTIICEKFEDTWSILQKIDIDINGIYTAIENINVNASATVDLSGVFTALEFGFHDTQTIICEKFEDTWTILQKIDVDVNGIFTALDNINVCATTDLSGIFTALEFGFYDTQTILCAKFEDTWTILGEINENVLNLFEFTANLVGTLTGDILDTQTILCAKFEDTWTILEKIDIDVNGIYTVLDNLVLSVTIGEITVSVSIDLSGVFTALEFGFYDTQTIICAKFEDTWTILEKIDVDVNGIFTAIEAIPTVDLSGIFTALEFGFYDTQTIVCEKFEQTWTILQKIDIDVNGIFTAIDNIEICATVDLSGIFTALEFGFFDTQTIMCEKFEQTWTILQKIDIDVNGIFTAIDNIEVCATVDLSGIFTALEFGFYDTQTILCAKFEDTWTILEKIDVDVNGIFTAIEAIPTVDLSGIFTALEFGFHDTQTILCAKFEDTWTILEKIDIDVNGIYTVLENLNLSVTIGEITISVSIDLSGVFTALEFGFHDTQTIICEKFEQTWTILQKIDIDVNGIFTAIDNIEVCATVDLSGIFTALEFGFFDTQTIMCEKFQYTWTALEFGFYDTQTIVCEKFEQTWTILQKIDVDVNGIFTAIVDSEVDLSGIFTALEFGFYDTQTIVCEKFEQTWTILQKIDIDVNGIFTAIEAIPTVDLSGIFTALEFGFYDTQTIVCEKFEQTWTILQKIDVDVNGIFTAIDNIEICATVDLSGIFTALEFGFFDTQTIMCEKFQYTWTALEFGFYDTQTILCEKFEDTWTILQKIDVDVNGIFTAIVDSEVDLSGIFTALEFGFYDTQTIVCEKFEQTWTILQKIDIDVNGIFTAIEAIPTVDLSGIFTALEFGFFDTQTIICAKFEDTWTILQKIDIDVNGIFTAIDNIEICATVDLSGVFTALEFGFFDTQTIMCEKFQYTWTALEFGFYDTQTILCEKFQYTWTALEFGFFDTQTIMCEKFQYTWTALEFGFYDTQTILCEKFQYTWTALEFGFFDTQTIICEKFEETWTILQKIDVDVNGIFTAIVDSEVDISGIFTALEFGFYDTQTIVCEKFEQTWTILQKIDVDVNGIFTAIVDSEVDISGIFTALEFGFFDTQTIMCEKFEQTWTILQKIDIDVNGIFTAIEAIPTVDLSGIFTALEFGFYDTQTIMCEKFQYTWTALEFGFFDTQTIMCEKFQYTWTALEFGFYDTQTILCEKFQYTWTALEFGFFDTQTIMCEKFEYTWSILAALEQDLSGVFTAMAYGFLDTKTVMCQKFQDTWTILDPIDAALCSPIEIRQAHVGVTTYTISQPGFYVFAENITFSPTGSGQPAIEITSNDVTIDMCGKILSQGNSATGVNGFSIPGNTAASPRTNVTIKNGGISGFTRAGVVVGTNPVTAANTAAQLITLKDLTVINCATRAIDFVGSSGATIRNSTIENCLITLCCTGASGDNAVRLEFTQCINVNNCEINNNGSTTTNLIALHMVTSSEINVNYVDIECHTVQSFTGIFINGSNDCLLSQCRVVTNSVINAFNGFAQSGIGFAGNMAQDLLVANNASTNGPLVGFNLVSSTRTTLQKCKASNNATTNSAASANCFGFNFDQTTSCCVSECIASNNRASGNGVTNICAGFNIGTSSATAGTGVKNCEFFANRAEKNSGFTDVLSFGIRAVSGTGGNTNNAYILNYGIRNGPGTPVALNQIVDNSGGGSPGGVPLGSIRDLTIAALNIPAGVLGLATPSLGISNIRVI